MLELFMNSDSEKWFLVKYEMQISCRKSIFFADDNKFFGASKK